MESEENWEETRRIVWAKVAKRMAEEYGLRQKESGETERFDRVLSLWIDVQQAVLAVEQHQRKPEGCTPWHCPDPRVTKAWTALTEARNLPALESLFCQLPDGPQKVLARKRRQRRAAEPRQATDQLAGGKPARSNQSEGV